MFTWYLSLKWFQRNGAYTAKNFSIKSPAQQRLVHVPELRLRLHDHVFSAPLRMVSVLSGP